MVTKEIDLIENKQNLVLKGNIMDARFKRGDEVYLTEDRGRPTRMKYKIVEYFLGDIPEPFAESVSNTKKSDSYSSDHNYMIEFVSGGGQRIVNEAQIE